MEIKKHNINRKSVFKISENDKIRIREYLKLHLAQEQMNIEKRLELARIKLYYKIGILDYYMAFGNFKITEENRDSIISNLRERAELSVMLQILEEEMFDLGLNPTNDLAVIKDIPEYLPGLLENENYVQNFDISIVNDRKQIKIDDTDIIIPSSIFHGTDENFDKENIGKKDDKGKYYLKDGVVYWAFEKSQAEKFTKDNNIIERKIKDNDRFLCIDDTNGGIAFICQDELYKASKEGIKYILCHNPHRSDVMDITYYADFVDTRDSILENKYKKISKLGIPLPSVDTSYHEYLKALKNSRNMNLGREI